MPREFFEHKIKLREGEPTFVHAELGVGVFLRGTTDWKTPDDAEAVARAIRDASRFLRNRMADKAREAER